MNVLATFFNMLKIPDKVSQPRNGHLQRLIVTMVTKQLVGVISDYWWGNNPATVLMF